MAGSGRFPNGFGFSGGSRTSVGGGNDESRKSMMGRFASGKSVV